VLDAQGAGILPARSAHRLWAAAALPVRFRVEVSTRWFVELEAAARMPLIRDEFVFQPQTALFKVPSVGGTTAAGVGVTFP
jgi:hypothetical protein